MEAKFRQADRLGANLYHAAVTHRLPSLLYLKLAELGLTEMLPPAEWEALRKAHAQAVLRQTRLVEGAAELLGEADKAGIGPLVSIKGLALAALRWPDYYPRDMADIDLLVAEEALDEVEAWLRGRGFTQPQPATPWIGHHHRPPLVRDGIAVELHGALAPPGRLPFVLPTPGDISARVISATVAGVPIRVSCLEDCVLIACVVSARDGFDVPLSSWMDIRWLMSGAPVGLSHGKLRGLAQDSGLEGLLSVVLRFCAELFAGGYVPEAPDAPGWLTYEGLREIMWRRLRTPGEGRRGRHRWLCEWLRRKHRATGGRRGRDGAVGRLGGPLAAMGKTIRYGLALLTSRRQRRDLRDQLAIDAALTSLRAGRG